MKEERMKIIEELTFLKNKQNESKQDLKRLQKELSDIESAIYKNKDLIEKYTTVIGELVKKKKELQNININSLNDDINQIYQKNEMFYIKQREILLKLSKLICDKKRLDAVNKELQKSKEDEILCWTCGKSHISRDVVERELEQIKRAIMPLQENLDSIDEEIKNNKKNIIFRQKQKIKANKISIIEKEIKPVLEKLMKLQIEKNSQKERIKHIEAKIPAIEANVESRAKKIEQKELELRSIEDKIKNSFF